MLERRSLWRRAWRQLRRARAWFADDGWSGSTTAAPAPRQRATPSELVEGYADAAYFCANLNARGVAKIPLRLYVRSAPGEAAPRFRTRQAPRRIRERLARVAGSGASVEEVIEHPLLGLLSNPCPEGDVPLLSRFELFERTQLSLEIIGRAYWLIEWNRLGTPSKLWLLHAHRVRPIAGEDGARLLDHYDYAGQQLRPEDVVAFRLPDLADPYVGGRSPLQAIFPRTRLLQKSLAQAEAVLDNRARPDAIISPSHPDAIIGDVEARRLEEAFQRRFRGGGAGGIFVSKDSLRVDPLSFAPKDLGDLSESQASLEQIARAFDVPLAMLTKDANRASAAEGRAQHARDALAPRVARIEQQLNLRLTPIFDPTRRLFFAFDDPAPENVDQALRVRESNLRLGFTTINEERFEEGWPPVPWGDAPFDPRRSDAGATPRE